LDVVLKVVKAALARTIDDVRQVGILEGSNTRAEWASEERVPGLEAVMQFVWVAIEDLFELHIPKSIIGKWVSKGG
jgi:hypothetical protein